MQSNGKIGILSENKCQYVCVRIYVYMHIAGWMHVYKTLNSDTSDKRNWKSQKEMLLFSCLYESFIYLIIAKCVPFVIKNVEKECLHRSERTWEMSQPLATGKMP